jgi:hypothetical protein
VQLRPKTKTDLEKLQSQYGVNSIAPLDEYLGIHKLPYKITVAAMLEIADWVQRSNSYEEAEAGLKQYTMIEVNDDTMRHVANTIGEIVFTNDMKRSEETFDLFLSHKYPFSDGVKKKGELYLECDGAMFHTRERDENGCKWRENKLGVVFSSDNLIRWKDKKTGEMMKRLGKREYTAYVGSVDVFQKLLLDCALRNGYGKYMTTILLTDGATWIKNMKNFLFYDAIHILDFFHLSENVTKFAKEYFNEDESLYRPWSKDISERLKLSDYQNVIKELESLNSGKLKKCTFDLHRYLLNNIESIDYARYLENGWYIGSGAIESANKTVLQERLKHAGMRWNVVTAQYIISLMTKVKSNLWHRDVVFPITRLFEGSNLSI